MVHHDFFVKKLSTFDSISMKWNFPKLGKSSKKVRKKFEKKVRKSKIVKISLFLNKMFMKYTRALRVVVDFTFYFLVTISFSLNLVC